MCCIHKVYFKGRALRERRPFFCFSRPEPDCGLISRFKLAINNAVTHIHRPAGSLGRLAPSSSRADKRERGVRCHSATWLHVPTAAYPFVGDGKAFSFVAYNCPAARRLYGELMGQRKTILLACLWWKKQP
jgi:hypothetical protein